MLLNASTKCNFCSVIVKIVGKLEDGTVFLKKGHDGDEPLEFKTDEGNLFFIFYCRKIMFVIRSPLLSFYRQLKLVLSDYNKLLNQLLCPSLCFSLSNNVLFVL